MLGATLHHQEKCECECVWLLDHPLSKQILLMCVVFLQKEDEGTLTCVLQAVSLSLFLFMH